MSDNCKKKQKLIKLRKTNEFKMATQTSDFRTGMWVGMFSLHQQQDNVRVRHEKALGLVDIYHFE